MVAPLKIEWVPIESLRPSKWNPNVLPLRKYNHLKRELARVGFARPIITNLAGDIINGEHRWRGGREMGFAEVPVVKLDVDETTAKTLSVNLNSIHGEMDHDKLALLVSGLEITFPKDQLMEILDYTDQEMTKLLDSTERDKGALPRLPGGPKPQPPMASEDPEGGDGDGQGGEWCECPKCGHKFQEKP